MVSKTPLAELIEGRMDVLNLSKETLGHRLGYRNHAKAAGRVYALCDHHPFSEKSRHALRRLPSALELPANVVEHAVAATERIFAKWAQEAEEERRLVRAADDAEWRSNFEPHAIIQTERTVPTQITLCGITGGPRRWLMIRFDTSQSAATYVQQAVDAVPKKTIGCLDKERSVIFFGKAVGLIINYTPNSALRCDLGGRPLELLTEAYQPGNVRMPFGGRSLLPARV